MVVLSHGLSVVIYKREWVCVKIPSISEHFKAVKSLSAGCLSDYYVLLLPNFSSDGLKHF